MAAITPVWSCDARQVVLELLLYSSWDMQKGGWEISQPPVWFQSTLPTLPWEQASICTLLTSRVQAVIPLALQPDKGTQLPSVKLQGWGTQNMAQTARTHRGFSSSDTGPNLITSLPFLPDAVWIFLTVLVVWEFFCHSPNSFQ